MELRVQGASRVQLDRGLVAARAVFARAGVTPLEAAQADWDREGWDLAGFDPSREPPEAVMSIADVWSEANQAAVAACCDGWAEVPRGAALEVTID